MSKSSSPRVVQAPAPPSAGESFREALTAFIELQPQRRQTELADLATQIELAQRAIPETLALQEEFGPQAIQQQITQEQQFAPEISTLRRQQLERDIAATEALAPRLRGVIEDPQTSAIRAELGRQLEEELALGAELDPSLRRETQQAIRSAQAARGLTRGVGPANAEALFQGLRGEQLRRSRQEAARAFLQTQAATAPDPFQAVTGRRGFRETALFPGISPQLPNLQIPAASTVPGLAEAGLAGQQLFNQQQFNAQQLALQQKQQGRAGLGAGIGTGLGAGVGFLVGGPMGAAVGASLGGAAGSGIGGFF